MTIAIADISMTDESGGKALTAVRGGYSTLPAVVPVPGENDLPRVPSLAIAFPFPIRFPEFPIRPDVCRGEDGGLKGIPL
jgi:hypothetical protein